MLAYVRRRISMTSRRLGPTQDAPVDSGMGGASSRAEPGLLLIFADGRPAWGLLPLGASPVELGRGQGRLAEYEDTKMSRQHACLSFSDGFFEITDLRSRNGSALDGVSLHGMARVEAGRLLRLGHSLFLCCSDLSPFRKFGINVEPQRIEGPALQQTLRTVAHFGGFSRTLFITGESGAGKESIAQAFHRAIPDGNGPFVAVNCAAIPEGVAERLLFGAKKGAFSGAVSDAQGYVEAADGGTLFLDEIAELDLVVQSKLLRVIEHGELLPLGATRPKKVQFRVAAATHRDLRALAETGRFRADLYFRIGMPQITVPPLRERKEEIPYLIAKAVESAAPGLAIDVSLVEASLLRSWPGNVRELQAEISAAALTARAAGKKLVTAGHLRLAAGVMMQWTRSTIGGPSILTPPPDFPLASDAQQPAEPPSRSQILAALLTEDCNIAATARALGLHRTQLRRLLARYSIDLGKLRTVGKGVG